MLLLFSWKSVALFVGHKRSKTAAQLMGTGRRRSVVPQHIKDPEIDITRKCLRFSHQNTWQNRGSQEYSRRSPTAKCHMYFHSILRSNFCSTRYLCTHINRAKGQHRHYAEPSSLHYAMSIYYLLFSYGAKVELSPLLLRPFIGLLCQH
jgi:hypothetical protein